jgi:formylglycine-generating enzyme required for sulfatase activity
VASLVALTPGTVFAKDYRVVGKLNEGGMGSVYTVEQISTGRQRALKLMHPELVSDPSLRSKFEQEAKIGGRIESEHVVEVVAAGVDEETQLPFLVMELLLGEDLSHAIKRRGAMTAGEVAVIFDPLCHAVGAAHAANIVHRDLKPENVFLAQTKRSGAAFTVKVLDFGIAKVLEEARSSANTGAVGSPYWMAPEQTERKAAVTASVDVWALGLIAYFLLTGKPFWRCANDEDGTVTNFLRELVLEPIPAASARANEFGVGDKIPVGFDAWFAHCVHREPVARFANATLAWEALAPVLGAPSSIRGPAVQAAHVVSITQRGDATGDLGSARTMHHAPIQEEEEAPSPTVIRSNANLYIGGALAIFAAAGGAIVIMRANANTNTTLQPTATPTESVAPVTKRCPDGMASVPSGDVMIGAEDGESDERPAHKVTLNAFCIDLGEATVAEFAQCVKEGGCTVAGKTIDFRGVGPDDHTLWDAFCNTAKADKQNHPQNCVSWDQANAYCKWANKRLPTEEEWEYAARGTDNRKYPWGNELPSPSVVNGCGPECVSKGNLFGQQWQLLYPVTDGFESTAPTRTFEPGKSPFGVYDLEGNVSEWTASSACPYPGNNCQSDARSTRGAAWTSGDSREFRASARQKNSPNTRSAEIGLRCAK